MTINGIIAEFAEEAAFLHDLRRKAVGAPDFSLADLARLDERLNAQIDGLRVAGDAAWDICKEIFENDAEGIFAAAVLAFEDGAEMRIQDIMQSVGDDWSKARILVSALGWLPLEEAKPHIQNFLSDESSFSRYIGIAASAIHRHHPGAHLQRALLDPSPRVKARALRAYGELGASRVLNLSSVKDYLRAEDDEIRFSAAWSATLAGNPEALELLKTFVAAGFPRQEQALKTAMLRMDQASALTWQKQLAQAPHTVRLAVIASGVISDPALLPWIIEQMKTPPLSRVAGEAFTTITGIDITLEALQGVPSERFEEGPTDDPKDDNVAMDDDDSLPWPNHDLISAWWNKHGDKYQSSSRYLLGEQVSMGHLRQVLSTGNQRQRSAAALELAMMNPDEPLFEVRAPAFRQYD